MSTPRWWRIGVVFERDGDPWTQTFHVRALSERAARRLVAEAVGAPHGVHVCHPSDPLLQVSRKEEIAATYGPFRRSWADKTIAHLRERVQGG
jgi:hypothetical protein